MKRRPTLATIALLATVFAHGAQPPGFLDEPPPLPTSDTVILSGGTLVLEAPIADAVVVITRGIVGSWGKRGEVDVPADSVGRDMRGKWLVPEGHLKAGAAAAFTLYDRAPWEAGARIVGTVNGDAIVVES